MSRNYTAPGSRLLHLATDRLLDAAQQTGQLLGRDHVTVGVTGLSRAGKTVFLTTLLNNLTHAKRFDLFAPIAQGRFELAHFAPPASSTTPRFAFEPSLDALFSNPPTWTKGTTRISEIQLKIKTQHPGGLNKLTSAIGLGTPPLTVNLVDYPGEWLTDLPMLSQSFAEWSAQTLAAATIGARRELSAEWLSLVEAVPTTAAYDQRTANHLHESYATFLRECKSQANQLCRLQPGRFLIPGDLEGAEALNFCPLPSRFDDSEMYRVFSKRFEAYKAQIIAPFFDEHIARIDRQIVLVDLLGAISGGPEAVEELRSTVNDILGFFTPGPNNPLSTLIEGRKVERLMFAATKADHLPPSQHAALQNLLEDLLRDPKRNAQMDGAAATVTTLSALRAAWPATAKKNGVEIECVQGYPQGVSTDATAPRSRLYHPGQIPSTLAELNALFQSDSANGFETIAFAPPSDLDPPTMGLPQLRVDQALNFLIGDLT